MKVFEKLGHNLWLNKKRQRALVYIPALLLLTFILALTSAYTYSDNIQEGLATSLIRLHVVANSDSETDQNIKYKVRDNILKYMSSQSADLESVDDAKKLIQGNMDKIEQIARDTLRSSGFSYNVRVYYGNYMFPTKVYGDIILPPGEYESLRVVLGNGTGANWWCVMFPPLCFVDASKGVVPDSSKAQLKSTLSDEEFEIATSNIPGSDMDIKVKFKIVELLQQSKHKLASLKNNR